MDDHFGLIAKQDAEKQQKRKNTIKTATGQAFNNF
jgi:hypothetical protein